MTHNQIDYQSLKETKRHNLELEAQGLRNLTETARHNQAFEAETNRSNLVSESLRQRAQAETERSNLANESLKHESNVLNYQVGMATVSENRRHNYASEQEISRSNRRREFIDFTHNVNVEKETNRHNVESENAQTFSNVTTFENSRKNASANLINAEVNRWKAPSERFRNFSTGVNSLSSASLNKLKTAREAVGTFTDVFKIKSLGGR